MNQTRAASQAWVVVGLLWVVALLNYLDRQLITTMSVPIENALHIHHARFGLFSSMFLWIYGLVSPFAGFVADRVGRRKVIIFSLLVWSVATVLTGCVQSFEQMLAARALMGVSEAFYIPAAVAMIVDFHRGATRALATGLHLSGAYAGSILGGFGGGIATLFGWRWGFLAFGGVGIAYALLLAVALRKVTPPEAEEPLDPVAENERPRSMDAFRRLLTSRSFLFLLAMNAFVGAAFWTIKNWLPTFFNVELHIDISRAGIFGAMAFNAAAFVGMLMASIVSDRWSLSNPRARMLVPAIGFCIAAPCFFSIGVSDALVIAVGAVVVAGMAQGCLDANLMPALCTFTESRHRSTGYGLLNLVGTITGGLMTYLGGWLKDANVPFQKTFQAAAGLILLAGLALLMIRPQRKDAAHSPLVAQVASD
jgi:MFS family permease